MQFANKDELKKAIREYAIVQGRNVKLVKNDNKRIQAKCAGHMKCPFILFASKIDRDEQTFSIKTLSSEHECTRVDKLKYTNSRWLSKRFADKIRKNPEWDVGVFKAKNGKAWVFMSDKQKGLIHAIETFLPTAEHRMCVRHLYSNFRTEHVGLALKNILWVAARSTTIPWYEAEMDKMKEQDEEAWKWVKKRPAKNWSRSHFEPHSKCDMLLNNLCEFFYSWILDSRDKPILTCLERIRVYIMLRMANRRIAGTVSRHPVGPRIVKIIENNKLGASQCIPILAGESKYQWQRTNWPPIKPHPYKKQSGRPKKSRNKEPANVEVPAPVPPNPLPPFYNPPLTKLRRIYVKIRCSICGHEGHNKTRHTNRGTSQAVPNQSNQGAVGSSTVQGAAQVFGPFLISPTKEQLALLQSKGQLRLFLISPTKNQLPLLQSKGQLKPTLINPTQLNYRQRNYYRNRERKWERRNANGKRKCWK
ncbi:unnamed protein product [Prunus armeniaca]